jgi:VWFA-related protein
MKHSLKIIGTIAAGMALLLVGLGQGVRLPLPLVSAQEVPKNLQNNPQHEVSVILHLIQVYVTDKKGNPVRDLGKDDFIVRDNGQPIDLTEFETRVIAPSVPAAGPEAAPKTEIRPAQAGGVDAGRGGPANEPAMSRKFLLFFDFAFNDMRGIRKAKEAAFHFLDQEVKPGDEVGLFSYSLTRGLSIHEFLTVDQAKVRQALEHLGVDRIGGRAENIEQEYWLAGNEDRYGATPEGEDPHPSPSRLPANLRWRRQESKNQALNFINKLTTLAQALRYVPGQKHLILFSQGIAGSLMYVTQDGIEQKARTDWGDFLLREAHEGMLKELSAAGCRVFAFDTREAAKVPSLFDYEEQTFGLTRGAGRFMFTETGVQQNPNLFFVDDKLTGMYALTKLSKDTGGSYYSNINEYDRNLGQLESMTGAFYVLGYPVSESWDGRFHEITVDVKRKGLKVNAPRGFFNPVPFAEQAPLEKEFGLFDLALNDRPILQAPLAADMTALCAPFGPGLNLATVTRIPAETLAGLAGPEVEFVSLVFDESENLAGMRRAVHDLAGFKDQDVIFASTGFLKPGSYRCRVVVRNLGTGQAAVASSRIFVPGPQTSGLSLHSILWLRPGKDAAYLEGIGKAGGSVSGASPSWESLYSFNRGLFTPALGPIAADTPSIHGVVPCFVGGIPEPLIALRASVVDLQTGERTSVPITLHEAVLRGDLVVQLIEIGLAGVKPGSYVLYLYAEEKTTKANAHITAELTLR